MIMTIRTQIHPTLLASPNQQRAGVTAIAVPVDLVRVVVLEEAPAVGGAFAAFLSER
jgi:hypothetical protein